LRWIEIQRYKMIRPCGTLHNGESLVANSSENSTIYNFLTSFPLQSRRLDLFSNPMFQRWG
jgi:hypothetical protein